MKQTIKKHMERYPAPDNYTPEEIQAKARSYTNHPNPIQLTKIGRNWELFLNPDTKHISAIAISPQTKSTGWGGIRHFEKIYFYDLNHPDKLTPAGMELLENHKKKSLRIWNLSKVQADSLADFMERYTNDRTKERRKHNQSDKTTKAQHEKMLLNYGYTLINETDSTTGETVAYIPE